MIKTFVKHWIYELCIQQFFNAFRKNFSTFSKINNMKVGDTFRSIIIAPSADQEVIYYLPKVIFVCDHFFTIEGGAFDEVITEDGTTDVFDGGEYKVDIYPSDEFIIYLI